ncbi:DNA/RNA non-specific endonuclease [Adhaeribacter radiodurans]|uniref:DNA/RNA non-specific endonuclease n=1 Tax=Adhaeribacter radiodurans TaxID=2745197 RepID=A0A7L7L224_9BACT|nr:DNA/RNA non-specific endonuclease [Adhaeribacter radiodurans]QMU26841.1 DNA/RNA non-specific endonuclease [Adhaeribacter radiodurans]
MANLENYKGYSEAFIHPELPLPLPRLQAEQQADLAPVTGTTNNLANYINYSLVLSQSRGFPYFVASNIDGGLFKKVSRTDNWRKDSRIDYAHQWGEELYKARKSDFDKGHMTKREDVQWGQTTLEARAAADTTFYFTNAVPQRAELNQQIWADLENYILHTESVPNNLRIAVFTGPVLRPSDPVFVTKVLGREVQLPTLFWKVVIFTKDNQQLNRVGFLMGQEKLLRKAKIVKSEAVEATAFATERFMEFEDAETYQVNIATIEELTKLTLPPAQDVYLDSRPIKLVLEEVDINARVATPKAFTELGYRISNLVV